MEIVLKNKTIIIIIVVLAITNLGQYWSGKSGLADTVEVLNINPFEEYHNPDPTVIETVVNKIEYITVEKPTYVTVIKTDTVNKIQIPEVSFVGAKFDNGQGIFSIKVDDKLFTYEIILPVEGETIIIPKDSANIKIMYQRMGFMKSIGIGVNNKKYPELNIDFFFLNRLWFMKDLKAGVNYEYTKGELGNFGAVISWNPYKRFNKINLYSGWYFPGNDFRIGVKVKLFEL